MNTAHWPRTTDYPPPPPVLLRYPLSTLTSVLALLAAGSLSAAQPKFLDLSGLTQQATNLGSATPVLPSAATTQVAKAVTANGTNLVTSGMQALDEKHKLGSGDRLSFRIMEDQVDTSEPLEPKGLVVADTGDLEVPYIGRVPAVGKSCKQLAREIKTALEREYYYQATVIIAVELKAKSTGKVYVVGQVRQTGPVDMPGDEDLTLSKAVLRAGGFTDYADKRHVKVTRKVDAETGASRTFTVDLNEVLEEGKTDKDMLLEPGDTIFVASRLFKF
jgi:protein involved in polysaccharide export with SLBB domain